MVGLQSASGVLATAPAERPAGADVAFDLTTEVRWFFDGRVPAEVLSWFADGGAGLTEDRCDRYRLDGEGDIGVKKRAGTTLELKLRLGSPELFTIGRDLDGQLETWQRWSPADGLAYLTEHTIWVDVAKRVIKRRFSFDGDEVSLSEENRPMNGVGCDVEITTVEVDGEEAWTFAFAAFGPVDGHRRSTQIAWESLISERARPRQLRLECDNSCGYPGWMTKFLILPEATIR